MVYAIGDDRFYAIPYKDPPQYTSNGNPPTYPDAVLPESLQMSDEALGRALWSQLVGAIRLFIRYITLSEYSSSYYPPLDIRYCTLQATGSVGLAFTYNTSTFLWWFRRNHSKTAASEIAQSLRKWNQRHEEFCGNVSHRLEEAFIKDFARQSNSRAMSQVLDRYLASAA
ncbi:MAG: hypothetical protein M1828_001048 [Chrysothrix sp. TS-e1954]|nr:MAG: hypothetical protein M1828_001048 [Chrysothrix sp. TS-e1954]